MSYPVYMVAAGFYMLNDCISGDSLLLRIVAFLFIIIGMISMSYVERKRQEQYKSLENKLKFMRGYLEDLEEKVESLEGRLSHD